MSSASVLGRQISPNFMNMTTTLSVCLLFVTLCCVVLCSGKADLVRVELIVDDMTDHAVSFVMLVN